MPSLYYRRCRYKPNAFDSRSTQVNWRKHQLWMKYYFIIVIIIIIIVIIGIQSAQPCYPFLTCLCGNGVAHPVNVSTRPHYVCLYFYFLSTSVTSLWYFLYRVGTYQLFLHFHYNIFLLERHRRPVNTIYSFIVHRSRFFFFRSTISLYTIIIPGKAGRGRNIYIIIIVNRKKKYVFYFLRRTSRNIIT